MSLVDSHCHVSRVWYEPVEALIDQMDRNGVRQAVLIQILGQLDNGYQQACLRDHGGRFASVVAVDASRPDACDRLAALADAGAAGVRLKPEARSPGRDPLAIWRAASALGLAVSSLGNAEKFSSPEFHALLESLPDLRVVLEHLGGSGRPAATDAEARLRVFETARYPNVYLKVPGLGELAPRPAALPLPGTALAADVAILDEALERFGPERLMWGSDFPVVSSREGFANALAWTREAIGRRSPEALGPVFGGTARRVFKLPQPPSESAR